MTLEAADLSAKEKGLLGATGVSHSFIYDLTELDESVKFMRLYIDHYEKGIKKEEASSVGVGIMEDEEEGDLHRIAFLMTDGTNAADEKNFNISYIYDTGNSTGHHKLKLGTSSIASMSLPIDEKHEIQIGKPITVGAMVADEGDGVHLSGDLFQNEEQAIKDGMADYDHVYLFKVELLTEDPHKVN